MKSSTNQELRKHIKMINKRIINKRGSLAPDLTVKVLDYDQTNVLI